MTHPIPRPEPASAAVPQVTRPLLRPAAILVALAVLVGTALLGCAVGALWAALAPRALLVMTGPGQASLVHVETDAYIAADAIFVLLTVAGGVVSGGLGYLFAVRRHGPAAMAAVLAGALAAAFITRTIGERSGLGSFHHLLATLPSGAHLRDTLTLGSTVALVFWPLAAGLMAGGLVAFRGAHRRRAHAGPAPTAAMPGVAWANPARPDPGGGRAAQQDSGGGRAAQQDPGHRGAVDGDTGHRGAAQQDTGHAGTAG